MPAPPKILEKLYKNKNLLKIPQNPKTPKNLAFHSYIVLLKAVGNDVVPLTFEQQNLFLFWMYFGT